MNNHQRRIQRPPVAVALALMALTLGATVSVASQDGSDGGEWAPPVSDADAARELGGTVAVMRRPQKADEADAGEAAAQAVPEESVPMAGENLELRREVDPPGGPPTDAFIWPADQAVCVAFENIGGCAEEADLDRQGIVPFAFYSRELEGGRAVLVAGMAENGIDTVSIVRDGAPTVESAVSSNVFEAQVEGRPTALRFTDPEGNEREMPLPVSERELDELKQPLADPRDSADGGE